MIYGHINCELLIPIGFFCLSQAMKLKTNSIYSLASIRQTDKAQQGAQLKKKSCFDTLLFTSFASARSFPCNNILLWSILE